MQVEFPGATSAVRGRKKGRDSGGPAGWQVQVDGAGAPRGRATRHTGLHSHATESLLCRHRVVGLKLM